MKIKFKKKCDSKSLGFTLIELLAIIVILAIIAVITVPIILGIIDDAQMNSAKNSAYGFKDSVNKYYAQQLLSNQSLKLNDTYTVTNGTLSDGDLGDSNITSLPIQVSGKVPTSGTLTYSNNVLTSGCLVIGDYAITFGPNGEVSSIVKGNCNDLSGQINEPQTSESVESQDNDSGSSSQTNESQTSESVAFQGDSWATFIANVKSGDTSRTSKYKVGDTAKIKMTIDNSENEYTVRIANKPHVSTDNAYNTICSNANNSKTACGWVIEFVDFITYHQMNPYTDASANGDGSKGGWEYSEMRKLLNGSSGYTGTVIYDLLPDVIKNSIINTTVVSGHGSNDSTNFTTTDKLYLLSVKEIFNCTEEYDTSQSYTRQLDYYKNTGVTTSGSNNAVIKYDFDNFAHYWWLRSGFSVTNSSFMAVMTNGGFTHMTSTIPYGIAPAFRLAD